ncbi:hypothetical protein MNBD_ALPHA06-1729 [hydrothermal vent metagenome]|uniref:ABC transporter domain-containing protein n=1 Tax=hydrothermal vent metagenome TaxID=652676 RepID=A0A3B0S7X5_9ZZZZ
MFVATHLAKRFGNTLAVDDVSLTLQQGEIVGFLGQNGAGKSTTIRMLAGMLEPDQGQIAVDKNWQRHKGQIGYLPEGAPLYEALSPRQNLSFLLEFAGWQQTPVGQRINLLLEQLNLQTWADRAVCTLSKGVRRRTALAMAMAMDAPILLLDEPFDGFDPVQKRAGRKLLQHISPQKTILICTHSLNEAEAICDRVMILDKGKLLADGTVPQLLRQTKQSGFEQAFCKLVATK